MKKGNYFVKVPVTFFLFSHFVFTLAQEKMTKNHFHVGILAIYSLILSDKAVPGLNTSSGTACKLINTLVYNFELS